jgi:ferredoxin-type protein NapF
MTADPADGFDRRSLLRGDWLRKDKPQDKAPAVVRPPGAVAPERFINLCDGCGACAKACPATAILLTGPATALSENSPQLVAETAPCVMCDGLVCASACPTKALEPVTPEEMRIASLVFRADACWAAQGIDPSCDYCFDRCPRKGEAITYQRGSGPRLHPDSCTGCGVCVYFCPASPKALAAVAVV